MKVIFSLSLALLVSAVAAVAAPPSFKHLPNYMTRMQCDPFSKTALSYLTTNGIPAVRITYGWSQFGGLRGYHAAILFKWEGKFYFMDNDRMGPRVVSAKTDLGVVNHITPDFHTHTWMTDEDNERIAPRTLEELFEAARLLEKYRKQ